MIIKINPNTNYFLSIERKEQERKDKEEKDRKDQEAADCGNILIDIL